MAPLVGNVVRVRNFLNKGTKREVTMTEMAVFWKSLSDEEKKQFGEEADLLNPQPA
jgi:hypothetical protein